ncbi:MAG: serine/threonine-protein kinase [Planctomycetota bacterium]
MNQNDTIGWAGGDQQGPGPDAAHPGNTTPRTAASFGEHPGDRLGRYKLLEAIGEGGMGKVWMAEQSEPVRRRVALKIIKLGMDTREVVARFEAERQALALMEHPHIAQVFDGGATESGRPYFVMELVRGIPITAYCEQARAGLRERLELFRKVCDAIQHAHSKGVIHRDIKASNVLVTLHDGVPVPKVIDFGIAKATSVELTQRTLFTRYAQMVGTPECMAPEQAELSGIDIDTRADVYALGVLLYELVTGTKPFDVRKALESGYEEMLRVIREVDPARPSTAVSTAMAKASPVAVLRHIDVQELSRSLEGDLDWIVMKALEKDRRRRYDTANGFAEDVGRFLRGEPVLAVPPSAAYRMRKALRRHRAAFVAAGLLLTLLLLAAAGTTYGFLRATEARRVAERAKDEALEVARFSSSVFQNAEAAVGQDGDTALLRELLDGAAQRIASGELAGTPRAEASLRTTLGSTYRSIGAIAEGRVMLQRAALLGEELYPKGAPARAKVAAALARLELDAANYDAAERGLAAALDAWRAASALEHAREIAAAEGDLARVAEARGDLETAERRLRAGLAAATSASDRRGVSNLVSELDGRLQALLRARGRQLRETDTTGGEVDSPAPAAPNPAGN